MLNYGIDKQGYVVNPTIKYSSGSDAFNEAALDVMQDWQFELAYSFITEGRIASERGDPEEQLQ